MTQVRWLVRGFLADSLPQKGHFVLGSELRLKVVRPLGPAGISPVAGDLLDLAAVVFQIERHLSGRQKTNPPSFVDLTIPVRNRKAWSNNAIQLVAHILTLLGRATWTIHFQAGSTAPLPEHLTTDNSKVDRVALFSGGLDSTCGAAALDNPASARLISFYTGQKALQVDLAARLKRAPPIQWGWAATPTAGRGLTYNHRSFLFLCLAAASANSWGAREVLQFENGILALAIPPAPNYRMTRHAHPELHRLAAMLFSSLFGGDWIVHNPFQLMTKRECFAELVAALGEQSAHNLADMTQTCWGYRSARVRGGRKRPGVACGVCVPCLIRRTAAPETRYQWDLTRDTSRDDELRGAAFRSYYGFLSRIQKKGGSLADFYSLLDGESRRLFEPVGPLKLEDVHSLFMRFANEFTKTYL